MTSRKNETVCTCCKYTFWAWKTNRKVCYLCDPPPKELATQAVKEGL